jgi:hypothetical protein
MPDHHIDNSKETITIRDKHPTRCLRCSTWRNKAKQGETRRIGTVTIRLGYTNNVEEPFLSKPTCRPPPNPEELSIHDVSVVKSWDSLETSGNHGFSSNNLGIQTAPVHPFPSN